MSHALRTTIWVHATSEARRETILRVLKHWNVPASPVYLQPPALGEATYPVAIHVNDLELLRRACGAIHRAHEEGPRPLLAQRQPTNGRKTPSRG